jgi:outer membrane protein assembly factor BamB
MVNRDSTVLWTREGRYHHDVWVGGGEIYALARNKRRIAAIHPELPTYDDAIEVLSIDGTPLRSISLLDVIRRSPYAFLLPDARHREKLKELQERKVPYLDILHTNHVEVFDGRLARRDPVYRKGNILVSMRNINAVVVLDGRSLKIKWIWGPSNLAYQHHPVLLENGNILVFDNGTKHSRVVEVDPIRNEIVWTYGSGDEFFSATRGGNQRLPNGNTLITNSDRGYVFEVTPAGEVVWKFANPSIDEKGVRTAIWRMVRVDPASLTFL